ncbi:hypothetical protein KAW18_00145 [candidate division WOR-3 bacterium]|jgi:hypothetical protein|nr:hypothetical protein [candidate division WOR-3 bacterium]
MSGVINVLNTLIEKANKAIEEGKALTTKQRKRMKKTTFCGPGRSFPVPNCRYVGIARAYLARSKFSAATKKRIAACINRKEKEMNCKGAKKKKTKSSYDEIGEFEYRIYSSLNKDERELYLSDDFKATKQLVEESIKNPNIDLEF